MRPAIEVVSLAEEFVVLPRAEWIKDVEANRIQITNLAELTGLDGLYGATNDILWLWEAP